MAGSKCPNCGGVLKSDPVVMIVCQGCSLPSPCPQCPDCGNMIKWNDSDEGRDSTCQTCADHVPQCPNCDGEQWKKSDDGSSWRGCLDCELYFDEAFLKQFHSESAEWEEWKVKNEFQSSSMEDAIKKYKDLPKDTLAKEMGYENHEQWENDIKKMERSIKKTELKNKEEERKNKEEERICLRKIEEVCQNCSLNTNVLETASDICQKEWKRSKEGFGVFALTKDSCGEKLSNRNQFIAAVVYVACKQCDAARTGPLPDVYQNSHLKEILQEAYHTKEVKLSDEIDVIHAIKSLSRYPYYNKNYIFRTKAEYLDYTHFKEAEQKRENDPPRKEICSQCNGTGKIEFLKSSCPFCDGTGDDDREKLSY